MTGRR